MESTSHKGGVYDIALSSAALQIAGFYNQNSIDLSKTLHGFVREEISVPVWTSVITWSTGPASAGRRLWSVLPIFRNGKGHGCRIMAAGEISNSLQRIVNWFCFLSKVRTDNRTPIRVNLRNSKQRWQNYQQHLLRGNYLLNNSAGARRAQCIWIQTHLSMHRLQSNFRCLSIQPTLKPSISQYCSWFRQRRKVREAATASNNTFIATAPVIPRRSIHFTI